MLNVRGKMASAGTCNAAENVGFGSERFNASFPDLTLLTMIMMSLSKNSNSPNCDSNIKKEYDFVIVGAGSAGSVVASRLSEIPCVSVLLLEAGGEPPPLTDVPAFTAFFEESYIDWNYKTVPQKNAAYSIKDRRVTWRAGKVLGGTSTINALLYVRGNHQNYDNWEALGASGWSYSNVLRYFLKLEDNRNIDEMDPGYHSTGGPIAAEKPAYEAEIKQPLLEAANEMGYEFLDSNGKRQTGFYDFQATTRHHKRDSSYKGYLGPEVRSRSNLKILTHAYATKILIRGKRAYGVEFDQFNKTYKVRARREVIISSGTIKTPQILMLSGIGPKDQLKKFDIDVVADLPVGKNLQDHVFGRLLFTLDDSVISFYEKIINPINAKRYIETESGPYTSPFGVSFVAFLRGINTTSKSLDFPRQEIYLLEAMDISTTPSGTKKAVQEVRLKNMKPTYECASSLLQPESRGEITLNSKDPFDMPSIDPNYYKEARDLEDVVEGMKICYALSKQPAMEKLKPELVRWKFPACEGYYSQNMAEYFTCIAKYDTRSFWHYAGTARMGDCSDPNSVVDPQLRVIGIRGLRVISAAIMPIVTSGNTNVPTLMIAEKGSDMIKRTIRCQRP